MFKRRIIRDDDYARLLSDIEGFKTLISAQRAEIDALRERLIDAEASKRSAQTMRDGLVTRVNQLETESASLRHKLTGLPTIAPQIERGNPLRASEIGAGVDLFEDVGDDKAKQLREAGLLHDPVDPLPFPRAADMTAHLSPTNGSDPRQS